MHRTRSAATLAAIAAASAALPLAGAGLGASALAAAVPASHATDHAQRGHRLPHLAGRWTDAWRSDDPEELARLFTKDAVYRDHGVGKVSRGRRGVAAWQANTHALIEDVDATIHDAFRAGDRMVIETTYRGHIKGAPRPFAVPMVTVLHLRGNRIATDTDTYNLAALLAQSGLPPTWTPPEA